MTVDPRTVLAARRGFLYEYQQDAYAAISDDDLQIAEDLFDTLVLFDNGDTPAFYERYAELDPWKKETEV